MKLKIDRRVDNRRGCGSGETALADCSSYALRLVYRGRVGVLGGNEVDTGLRYTGLR